MKNRMLSVAEVRCLENMFKTSVQSPVVVRCMDGVR